MIDKLNHQRWTNRLRSLWTVGVALLALFLVVLMGWWNSAKAPAPQIKTTKATSSPVKSTKYTISKGAVPAAALETPPGYAVHVFASGLGQARDLALSPGGTLLVSNLAEGTVIAMPDANHDGSADSAKVIARGSTTAHGVAFYNGKLYVAEIQRVVRYAWDEATLTAKLDKVLFNLPDGPDHNRRTLAFDARGNLYVSVGSTCNVCRETDSRFATVMQSDSDGNNPHIFATGLRNAAFLAVNPASGELWATEMGRDYLGDNLPPDEIDIIQPGSNYGWPNCYGNKIHDDGFDKNNNSCSPTQAPIFQIRAHSAPLGLAFVESNQFPADVQGDLLVSYHGSWNRSVPDGYKVVLLNVEGNRITGSSDFITGFISGSTVISRPVDVQFDQLGNLFVSDDKGGNVFIVQRQN